MTGWLSGKKAICAFIGKSERTYHRLRKQGLPVHYVNGRAVALPSELISYLKKRDAKRKKMLLSTL